MVAHEHFVQVVTRPAAMTSLWAAVNGLSPEDLLEHSASARVASGDPVSAMEAAVGGAIGLAAETVEQLCAARDGHATR